MLKNPVQCSVGGKRDGGHSELYEVSGEACGISGRRELEEVARLAHVVR